VRDFATPDRGEQRENPTMPSVLMPDQRAAFAANYNRTSFAFAHSLHESPIFNTPELIAMAARLPDPAYYSTAQNAVGDGWSSVGDRTASLQQTLETLPERNALVLLKHCERDPEYGPIFRGVMDDVVDQVGDALRTDLDAGRATLVISSPGRVTSYHIDAEVNFLLQVRGHKLLHTFNPNDAGILSDAELEHFYGGDPDGADYKCEREDDARVFTLEPGAGVHLPLHAPHWAQSLDGISVGLSLNFNLRSGARLAKLYKVNKHLRRIGLNPGSPGASSWLDGWKLAAFAGASYVRPRLRSRRAAV
jgi:hypothetical protein